MAEETQELTRFPPLPKTLDYPVLTAVCTEVVAVTILLLIAKRFDPSGGSLTIALIVTVAFIGVAVAVCIWTIPPDEETATILGSLATAFGAVVAFWLRGRDDK